MSDFFSFLKSNRSEIGLVDSYDLGEIYDADQRDALKNIFLDPDALDQIYKLSRNGVIKEDIRTAGGLDRSVISSLAIDSETLSDVSYDISRHIRTNDDIGEPGKHSFGSKEYSDNIIVFHGGIAANNIEYKFLDEDGELRTTTVPTSRESLFNSVKDSQARVTLASYSSLFRIRRRSHVNEIRLKPELLIPRQTVIESPTDILKIPVYMRTQSNQSPSLTILNCYATKNSPLILPVRIGTSAEIILKRSAADAASRTPFVFGWELKRNRDNLLVESRTLNSADFSEQRITIDVVGKLAQNQDCKLFIYLDPSQIEELDLSGLGMKENAGQDIGLIGFTKLKRLKISNNELSTYPVWLKTLNTVLETLDISGNSYWNNGIVEIFDYQDMRNSGIEGRSDAAPPTITATQVLGYSGYRASGGGAQVLSYTGEFSTITDSQGKFYKDLRKDAYNTGSGGGTTISVTTAEGFRTFSALKELIVGPSVRFINADFSKIFPNLENFQAPTGGNSPRVVLGLLPKFRNNGQFITVNYDNQHQLGGTINLMGDTPTWTNTINTSYNADNDNAIAKQFIGQFKVKSFNSWHTGIRGGFLTGPNDVESVAGRFHVSTQANVPSAWKGWIDNLESATLGWYSQACFKVATGTSLDWKKMSYLMLNHAWDGQLANTVFYNSSVTTSENSTDILVGSSWSEIHAWRSGWSGKVFSIRDAKNLGVLNWGNNEWNGYGNRADGFRYLLPANFVAKNNEEYKLRELYLHYLINGPSKRFIFRFDDLKYLPNISQFHITNSGVFGKFPVIYNDGLAANKRISVIEIGNCNFRDLSSLGSSSTKRVEKIYFYGQGASVGGSLMPNFTATSNAVLSVVNGGGSLSSSYPSGWRDNTSLAGRPIEALFGTTPSQNTVPGVTWYLDSNTEGEGERIIANNANNVILSGYVMVGDQIIYNTNVIGVVTQLDSSNGYIYARGSGLNALPTSGNNQLTFRRAGQDISGYFERHTNLSELRLSNNRIVGTIPKFTGCINLVTIDLSNNLLTDYEKGTIGTQSLLGTRDSVKLTNFSLENNPLTRESVRKIIKDCYDFVIAAGNRYYNININLSATFYDSSTKSFRKWTRAEIFTATIKTVPAPTENDPNATRTMVIQDPYESYFNRMGSGNTYPSMKINLF